MEETLEKSISVKCKYLIPILLLLGCHQTNSDAANSVMSSYAKQIQNKGLTLAGSGGSMMNSIKRFHMNFDTSKLLTLNEARKLMVQVMHEFLDYVNSNEKIRSRLAVYPISYNNVKIMIGYRNGNSWKPPREYIAFIFNQGHKIIYSHWNHAIDDYCDDYEETFDEAIKWLSS